MSGLTAYQCNRCDFGQRGMDQCCRCDGTGSIFFVQGHYFANTKEGYEEACKAAGIEPTVEDTAA